MRRYVWLLLLLALFLAGCTGPSNLTPVALKFEPTVQIVRDPGFRESDYRTFSVFPYSSLTGQALITDEIMVKQMLFALRNAFELMGYKFVPSDQSPDFIATIDGQAPYQSTYVPPRSVTVPQWVPGKTVTTYGNSSGSFSTGYNYGSWNGTSSATTYVPGYLTSNTYTRPGGYVGAYYPSLAVGVYDGKTKTKLWSGTGVGTSPTSGDIRVSGQLVLLAMVKQSFPFCPSWQDNYPVKSGRLGFAFAIFTVDGNNYLPAIVDLAPNLPAQKAGIQLYDLILAVDGRATVNKPYSEVGDMLSGEAGSTKTLTIWRLDKQITFTLTMAQR